MTDPLAALLHELSIGCMEASPEEHEDDAARLRAAGVTTAAPAKGLDVERLAPILDAHYDEHAMSDEDGHCDRLCAAAIARDLREKGVTTAAPAKGLDVDRLLDPLRYDGMVSDPWQHGWNAALSAAKRVIAREYAALEATE